MPAMIRRMVLIGLALLGPGSGEISADTLFLTSGKTLKIEALSCDSISCVATFPGGQAEIPAIEVLRVEPDEDVESLPELTAGARTAEDGPGPLRAGQTVERLIAEAASRYGLPRSLVRAVARAESALDPRAVSAKGAQGVMQLMPATARELGVLDPLDPAQNIDAGARLLREHLERFDGRLAEALAAYNAGLGAVAKHKGVPPYAETRRYIRRIVKDFDKAQPEEARRGKGNKKP